MGDHEYEPVAAPPPRPVPPPVFLGWEADEDPEEMKQRLESATADGAREELERQFLHSGLDDDPGPPPVDGAGEEEAMEEIQGTPPSPSPPSLSRTPTTESRTDCELTTSQVDSSGLEELPLRRGARGGAQKTGGGVGPITTTIKRKIRNQAGRLRTKMRSIPRPTFKVPESLMRVGKGGGGGATAATPESTAASTTQDSASSAADTMERPLRVEKKRTAAQLFDFRTYPRIFERKLKARGEFFSKRASSSGNEDSAAGIGSGPPPRKKMPFGTRWAHRFSDIRYADDEEATGSPARENGSTSSLRGSAPGGSWSGGSMGGQEASGSPPDGGRPGVLEEIDADEFFLREKGLSRDDVRRGEEISSEIRDALRPQATADDEGDGELERRMRRAEEEEEQRRRREEEEEEEEEMEMEEEEEMVEVEMTPPQRPSRRSTSASRHVVIDQGFMTFPPQRPFRRKGKIVRAAECEDIAPLERGEEEEEEEVEEEVEEDEEPQRWRNGRPVVVDGAIMAENLVRDEWEEGWGRKEPEVEEEKVLTEGVMAEGGRGRMSGLEAEEAEERAGEGSWRGYVGERLRGWLGGSGEEEVEKREEGEGAGGGLGSAGEEEGVTVELAPPMPPKRRRRAPYENSAVSLDNSRCISTEEVRMEEFNRSSTNVSLKQQLSDSAQLFPTQVTMATVLTSPDPEYASPSRDLSPPVAPRRTRSLPRRPKEREEPSPVLPRASTSVPPRPQRKQKMMEFFTVPRRKPKKTESPPPQRPARSGYATPGPPKAPGRRRPSTPLPASVPPSEDMGIESGEERVKELTAGEVVSKMRARPLPPPPRPPRRDRTRSADRSSWEEVIEGHLTLGSDRAPESITSAKSLTDHGRIPPEEVSIAIQTDPLPYEYCMEDGALEESAPPTGSEQTSEVMGRRSPMTWPTPPPTPPPTARRQRRQAASRRAAAAAEKEAAEQPERPPEIEKLTTIPPESILAEPSPPLERRVPTPAEEVPQPPAPEVRLAEDIPPSIPPLPTVIPAREQPPEDTIAVGASPPPLEPPAPVSVSSPPPPPVPPAPTAEAPPPVQEPIGSILVMERPVKAIEETFEAAKIVPQVEQPPPPPAPVEVPPVAPPRPPKPIPRPAEVVPAPPPSTEETCPPISIPPPSFEQLRSPEEPVPTVPEPKVPEPTVQQPTVQQPTVQQPTVQQPTVQQPTVQQPTVQQLPPHMMPQQYPYSIPPPFFFPSQSTTEDPQGRPMPPAPPMGAVALLCVGEISARKLVVSEFQTGWGSRDSQDSSSSPPPETRRTTGRGPSESGGRRRMPSVPTARRRPPPRRTQSESGGKEGKEGKEDFADPEDPELPGIGELSGRLARACGNAAVSSVRQLLLSAVERVEGDGRTEAAIIIALVMAVALVVLTMGHTRQGHRWDFYLPPAP